MRSSEGRLVTMGHQDRAASLPGSRAKLLDWMPTELVGSKCVYCVRTKYAVYGKLASTTSWLARASRDTNIMLANCAKCHQLSENISLCLSRETYE
jgi:hypothetical protein